MNGKRRNYHLSPKIAGFLSWVRGAIGTGLGYYIMNNDWTAESKGTATYTAVNGGNITYDVSTITSYNSIAHPIGLAILGISLADIAYQGIKSYFFYKNDKDTNNKIDSLGSKVDFVESKIDYVKKEVDKIDSLGSKVDSVGEKVNGVKLSLDDYLNVEEEGGKFKGKFTEKVGSWVKRIIGEYTPEKREEIVEKRYTKDNNKTGEGIGNEDFNDKIINTEGDSSE